MGKDIFNVLYEVETSFLPEEQFLHGLLPEKREEILKRCAGNLSSFTAGLIVGSQIKEEKITSLLEEMKKMVNPVISIEKREFKIGDKVLVTSLPPLVPKKFLGMTGIIRSDGHSPRWNVYFVQVGDDWFFGDKHLQLVEEK